MISLPARPDESVRTGSEVVQTSENKDMFLSFERIPVLDFRHGGSALGTTFRKRGLSSDQKFNSANLSFARVNVFSLCSA